MIIYANFSGKFTFLESSTESTFVPVSEIIGVGRFRILGGGGGGGHGSEGGGGQIPSRYMTS